MSESHPLRSRLQVLILLWNRFKRPTSCAESSVKVDLHYIWHMESSAFETAL